MRARHLTNDEVRAIREEAAVGVDVAVLAAAYGTNTNSVYMLLRGDSYPDAGGPLRPARRRYSPDLDGEDFVRVGRQLILDNVVVSPSGCWLWVGTHHSKKGYRDVKLGAKSYLAHRLSFLVFNGPVPDGFDVGHHCHDQSDCQAGDDCLHRSCVRPQHLRAMSHEENIRAGRGDWRGRLTHCLRGHPFDESNTAWRRRSSGGWQRVCRACARERAARRRLGSPEVELRDSA